MKQKIVIYGTVYLVVFLLGISSAIAEPFAGYTLYNPTNGQTTYLIDMDGDVQHSWNHNRGGGYGVYLLPNGHLLRPQQVANPGLRGGAMAGLIQEKNWDGNLIWEFEYNSNTYITHHDIEPMPNGNVLAIAWEVKTAAQSTQAGRDRASITWPDHIIEVEPDGDGGAEIVWEWHAWDHMIQDHDDEKDNYGVVADHPELLDINMGYGGRGGPGGQTDWIHINGVSYNPNLDQIVISSHFADEFFVIDHSTTTEEAASHEGGNSRKGGDILYRWGFPGNYDADGDEYFDVIHCSWWIPEGLPGAGNILVFNNAEGDEASEIVEIEPPLDEEGNYIIQNGEAFGPDEPIWTYSDGRDFYSNHLGSCQRLPNGNTLISESTSNHLLEVDVDGNTVWEFDGENQIARSLRYASNYLGLYDLHPVDEGTIVINEFLIDNSETMADQDDEFDSWIEIYNNSDIDQSLWGFNIVVGAEVTFFTFPDTIIAANDYLIIWADSDIDQEGLHASVELSAVEGELILKAPNNTTLDAVELAEQSTDISYGRFPNGTGDFIAMTPSFGSENNDGILSVEDDKGDHPDGYMLMNNYPNPFNSSTTINFNLRSTTYINLTVFSSAGETVSQLLTGMQDAGFHEVVWNGTNDSGIAVSSGVYIYRLESEKFNSVRKTLLIR